IGANGERRDIERTEPLAGFLEAREVTRITREIKPSLGAQHRPRRPESFVRVRQCSLGKMLSRNAYEFHGAIFALLPPVHLFDPCHSVLGQLRLETERNQKERMPRRGKALYGR